MKLKLHIFTSYEESGLSDYICVCVCGFNVVSSDQNLRFEGPHNSENKTNKTIVFNTKSTRLFNLKEDVLQILK